MFWYLPGENHAGSKWFLADYSVEDHKKVVAFFCQVRFALFDHRWRHPFSSQRHLAVLFCNSFAKTSFNCSLFPVIEEKRPQLIIDYIHITYAQVRARWFWLNSTNGGVDNLTLKSDKSAIFSQRKSMSSAMMNCQSFRKLIFF